MQWPHIACRVGTLLGMPVSGHLCRGLLILLCVCSFDGIASALGLVLPLRSFCTTRRSCWTMETGGRRRLPTICDQRACIDEGRVALNRLLYGYARRNLLMVYCSRERCAGAATLLHDRTTLYLMTCDQGASPPGGQAQAQQTLQMHPLLTVVLDVGPS